MAGWPDGGMARLELGGVLGGDGRMAGWPDGQMAGWPDGRMAGWPAGRMAGWPDGRMAGWPDSRMAGWPDGRMVGWPGMAGWRDGGMASSCNVTSSPGEANQVTPFQCCSCASMHAIFQMEFPELLQKKLRREWTPKGRR